MATCRGRATERERRLDSKSEILILYVLGHRALDIVDADQLVLQRQ